MGAAPLSWLAKIGGDTLKTKAKLLSSAINELHDDGLKFSAPNIDNATFRYNESEGKFELLYKGGNTYSLLGWNDDSFSYDYFNGTEWVRKWDLNSNFVSLKLSGTTSVYGILNTDLNCADVFIMSAYCNGYSVLPAVSSSGKWFFHVFDLDTTSLLYKPVINTSVEISYMYKRK